MRRFVISCCLFFLLIVACFCLIDWTQRKAPKSDYMKGIVLKHNRIDSIQTPKIILAGGSNLAFGIDSKSIQDSLGMPVVNLALHAGLGLDFMLNELKYSIKENDIVFLSIEYFLSGEGDYGMHQQAKRDYAPAGGFYSASPLEVLKYYIDHNRRNLKTLLSKSPKGSLGGEENKEGDSIYSSNAFNSYGDVVSHLARQHHANLGGKEIMTDTKWPGVDKINEFCAYAKSKHVPVYYLFPNYPIDEYQNNKTAIDHLQADINRRLSAPVLNEPATFLYPDSLFFDTVYHLTASGRHQRTDKLIQLLKGNALVQRSIQGSLALH